MERSRLFVLLGLVAVLSSGCVALDYAQKVERDGTSQVTLSANLSRLLSMDGSGSGSLEGACENLTSDDESLECRSESGVLTLSRKMKPEDGFYTFNKTSEFPYSVYSLEVGSLPQIPGRGSVSAAGVPDSQALGGDFSSPGSVLSASTLRTAGASVKYRVQMPGDITSAEGGEILSDAQGVEYAEFDVLERMGAGKHIVVVSREYDMVLLSIIAAAAVVFAGGIVVALVLLKAMKK